jgi:hypothetical protein
MRPADHRIDLTSYEVRRSARDELIAVTEELIAEFAGRVPAGTVIRHLALAREQLLADGVRAGVAVAAEAMARMRLVALVPAHSLGA